MTQHVAPYTEKYTSVSTLIAQLKAQREKAMPLVRVPTDDLMKRPDRPAAQPVVVEQPAELYPVGTRIFCRFMQMEATVIAITPHRIRVEWAERGIKGCPIRRGWLFREDCEPVESKAASR